MMCIEGELNRKGCLAVLFDSKEKPHDMRTRLREGATICRNERKPAAEARLSTAMV